MKIDFLERPRNLGEKVSMVVDEEKVGLLSTRLESLLGPTTFKSFNK